MIYELRQPIEVETPLGSGVAFLIIDYGWAINSCWVVILENGQVKHFDANDITVDPIHTWGIRKYT